jgi:hypothetical protein
MTSLILYKFDKITVKKGKVMIKKSMVIIMILLATNLNAQEKKWYQHGELYKYKMNKWHNSSLLEKLSFSANFITLKSPKVIEDTKTYGDMKMEILKLYSTNLSICIDQANDESMKDFKILDTAQSCLMFLKWD